jgi:hypothetical protein
MEACFQTLDPHLGARVIGVELTRLGARTIGAKVLGPRRCRRRRGSDLALIYYHVGVDADVAVTWR